MARLPAPLFLLAMGRQRRQSARRISTRPPGLTRSKPRSTDNMGASSSTISTVVVKPQFVTIYQPHIYFDNINLCPRHGDVFLGLPRRGDAGLSGWRAQIPIVNGNGGHNSANHGWHTPDHYQGLGLIRSVVHVVTNRYQKLNFSRLRFVFIRGIRGCSS